MATPSRLPAVRRPGGGTASGKSRPMSMIEGSLGFSLPGSSSNSSKTSSNSSKPATKTSKRLSLLPQFSSSRKAAIEERVEQEELEEEEQDELSCRNSASTTETSISHEPNDRRTGVPSSVPKSRLMRPSTMYSMGVSKLPGVKTQSSLHSRGQSTASVRPTTRDEALATLNGTPRTTSLMRNSSVSQKPTGGAHHTRQQSSTSRGHARTNSTATVSSMVGSSEKRQSVTSIRPPSSSQTSPPRALTYRSQMPPPSRPAFNAYQQHYSPAKGVLPKPPIPTTRNGRSQSNGSEGPINEGIPSEQCLSAQVELLQLSLVHQNAVQAIAEFDSSAKQKLARKHAKLRKDYESVRALEQEQQRITNLTALDSWVPDADLLVEYLHIVDRIHSELNIINAPAGKYTELVASFEAWMETANPTSDEAKPGFVEKLPEQWHDAHASLVLKVRALQREFESLPRVPRGPAEKSSIGFVLADCRNILENSLQELDMMTKLEQGFLEREKTRLDREVEKAVGGHNGMATSNDPWKPAWQIAGL